MANMLTVLKNSHANNLVLDEETKEFPIALEGKATKITKHGFLYRLIEKSAKSIIISYTADLEDGRKQIVETEYYFGRNFLKEAKNNITTIMSIKVASVDKDGHYTTTEYSGLEALKENNGQVIRQGKKQYENGTLVRDSWTESRVKNGATITRHIIQTQVEKVKGALYFKLFTSNNAFIALNSYYKHGDKIFGAYDDRYFGTMYRTQIEEIIETQAHEEKVVKHVCYGSKEFPASYYHEIKNELGTVAYLNEHYYGYTTYDSGKTWSSMNNNAKMYLSTDAAEDANRVKKVNMSEYSNDNYLMKPTDSESFAFKIYDDRTCEEASKLRTHPVDTFKPELVIEKEDIPDKQE